MQNSRRDETDDAAGRRREENRRRMELGRQEESEETTQRRREENRRRMEERRREESQETAQARRERNRRRMEEQRGGDSEEATEARRERNRMRMGERREQICTIIRSQLFFSDANALQHRLAREGSPATVQERRRSRAQRRVNGPPPPASELSYLAPMNTEFRSNIRQYNSALAMASMGAQLDSLEDLAPTVLESIDSLKSTAVLQVYHLAGPLHPDNGEAPSFAQFYIMDSAQAAKERMSNPANVRCGSSAMRKLSDLLSRVNRYAQAYQMIDEVVRAEEALAALEGRSLAPVRMIFDVNADVDRRRYNLPTCNEGWCLHISNVATAVYVVDEIPATRSFAVHPRSGELQNISVLSPACDPLCYPLFFPTGKPGWSPRLQKASEDQFHSCDFQIIVIK
ncbi:hypothetical protein OESDEN_10880, partial [Oesophagostomum dentatum]